MTGVQTCALPILISPAAAVLLIAPANVLHGAVRLQGFTSSPTPETHVRVACAAAGRDKPPKTITAATVTASRFKITMDLSPMWGVRLAPGFNKARRFSIDWLMILELDLDFARHVSWTSFAASCR